MGRTAVHFGFVVVVVVVFCLFFNVTHRNS